MSNFCPAVDPVASGASQGWDVWVVPVLGRVAPRQLLANAEGLNWIPEKTASRSDERTVYAADGIMDHLSYLSPDGKPGAKALAVASAFAGPNASVYAYAKASAHRNIYPVGVS